MYTIFAIYKVSIDQVKAVDIRDNEKRVGNILRHVEAGAKVVVDDRNHNKFEFYGYAESYVILDVKSGIHYYFSDRLTYIDEVKKALKEGVYNGRTW